MNKQGTCFIYEFSQKIGEESVIQQIKYKLLNNGFSEEEIEKLFEETDIEKLQGAANWLMRLRA